MKSLTLLVAVTIVAALALPAGASSPPQKKIERLERRVAALQAKVRRLASENGQLARSLGLEHRRQLALARRVAAVDPCPITRPNGSVPPGSTFGAEFHGNGALWVGLPPANVVVREPEADGSISDKFGWWRAVSGQLRIEGRRLDGTAPPLRAGVPDGYGDSGFQSSGIIFPTEGCWEVTGRVGDASLTFVTLALATQET
jgi:outer membrane murein-binding lipoprotein Lpp